MELNRLKLLSQAERSSVFETEAIGSEQVTYMKPLTDMEMTIIREELATASIAKALLDDELRQMKDDFKARIEPHATKITEAIESLKNRVQQVTGLLHKFIDYESKTVTMVDEAGNVIDTRMMKPEERQLFLRPESKESKTA